LQVTLSSPQAAALHPQGQNPIVLIDTNVGGQSDFSVAHSLDTSDRLQALQYFNNWVERFVASGDHTAVSLVNA
jgi:hypothetical protein